MRDGIGRFATIGLAVFVVIGCGGAAATGTATSAATAAASNGDAGSGDGTAASPGTEPATAAPATPEPAGGGGGPAVGVCELVTKDELAQIFGVASVTATVLPGPPDNCIVKSVNGDPIAAWSLTLAQAKILYDTLALPGQSTDVPGIGDKAAFVENTGLLVLKGNALLVVGLSSGAGDLSEDEQAELARQVAAKAAGRL